MARQLGRSAERDASQSRLVSAPLDELDSLSRLPAPRVQRLVGPDLPSARRRNPLQHPGRGRRARPAGRLDPVKTWTGTLSRMSRS